MMETPRSAAPTRGALVGVVVCALAWPASAQDTATDPITGESFEPVTYDEVLENPDDIDLNLRYARTLIRDGRLDSASATLERLLILRPNADRVRLLYAIVLYRLDNLVESKQEFQTLLDDGELDSDLEQQAQRYLDRIERRQRDVTGSLTIGGGVHVDSNRNSYPSSGDFRIRNNVRTGSQDENTDFGQLGFAEGRVDYDPGGQRLTNIYGEATGLIDNQDQEDDLDLLAGFAEVGARFDATVLQVTPHLRYEHLDVGGAKYAQIPEAGVRLGRTSHSIQGLNYYVANRVAYETYNDTSDLPQNSDQDGIRYEAEGGAGYNVSQSLRVEGSYRFTWKDADEGDERYLGHRLRANATYVFANQSFVTGAASLEYQDYDEPNPAISTTTVREDLDSRVRLTYGIPAAAILKAAGTKEPPAATKDLVVSMSGTYFNSESNLRNFDYENFRGSFIVTKRFEF